MDIHRTRRVLNAGSGPAGKKSLHHVFHPSHWTELRIDIDPRNEADFVGSVSDMQSAIEDASFDAVWCIPLHRTSSRSRGVARAARIQTDIARRRLCRVSCPNIDAIARLVVSEDIESVAYLSPAGPIRLLDMIFGHSPSIEAGRVHMAHRTGFTADRLGRLGHARRFRRSARARRGKL